MIWCNSVAATSKLGLMSCITKESISNIRLKLKDKQNSKYKPSRTAQNLNNQIGHNQDKSVKQTRFLLPTSKTCTKPNAHYNCTSRYPDSKYSIKLLWWENDTYMIQCLRRFFCVFCFLYFLCCPNIFWYMKQRTGSQKHGSNFFPLTTHLAFLSLNLRKAWMLWQRAF